MDAVAGEALQVFELGRQPFERTWRAMEALTDARGPDHPHQVWLLEHEPVFTLGQAGKPEHVLAPGDIPVVRTNRGGQHYADCNREVRALSPEILIEILTPDFRG